MALNLWSDVSGIANSILAGATLVLRENGIMQARITVFNDQTGDNPRVGHKYNETTASEIGEADDLTSTAFTPSADQTLTPIEIGEQFFVTDRRRDSDAPEDIIRDGGMELGLAALEKIEGDLVGDLASLTGGTIGAAGTAITWGYVAAAISRAQVVNKSKAIPLSCVIHAYQASVLAKGASIAGATSLAQAPGVTEQITRQGLMPAFVFMNVPIYQSMQDPDSDDDFTGGVFPRIALAIDWRRQIRVEPQRDASRRGTEFNMSGVYAHGVWKPDRGIQMIFDATAPTS